MGITGLLPALKSIMHKAHLAEYNGLRAGIDAYSWLHRGAHCCLMELALGQDTDKYVKYCMERIQLLLRHGISPVVVFDGARPPIKKEKNLERRRSREEAREKGLTLYQEGKTAEAHSAFKKAVVVTDHMARKFRKELEAVGVRYVVAPYEADAQLAYMSIQGIIDLVITEDGDTIPYGCRKVLFKLDKEGHGDEFDMRNLGANEELSFRGWNNNMFLDMCLLAGCDYLASIPGLGLKTAYKLVKKHRNCKKVLRELRYLTDSQMPDGYEEAFARARLAFRHHLVYDMEKKCMVPLNPFKDEHLAMDLSFIGQQLPPDIAQGIVTGKLHPTTHRPYTPDEDGALMNTLEDDDGDDEGGGEGLKPPAVPTAPKPAVTAGGGSAPSRHEVIKPSWAGLEDSPPDYHVSQQQRLGSAQVYTRESAAEDARRAAHSHSMRSVDQAIRSARPVGRVATAGSPTSRLPVETVTVSVRRHFSMSARLVPAPQDEERAAASETVRPAAPPKAPPSNRVADAEVDDDDDEEEEDDSAQGKVPRRSAYFPTAPPPVARREEALKVRNAQEASAALQRLEELERVRREEVAAQLRQRKRKCAPVTFLAPAIGIDFRSPVVSEQMETLYRRKKRLLEAGSAPGEPATDQLQAKEPQPQLADAVLPLRPQVNRSPSPSSLTLFADGDKRASGLDGFSGGGDDDDDRSLEQLPPARTSRYIEFVPQFAASEAHSEPSPYESSRTHHHVENDYPTGVRFFSHKTEVPVSSRQRSPPMQQADGLSIFKPPVLEGGETRHRHSSTLRPHASRSYVDHSGVGLFSTTSQQYPDNAPRDSNPFFQDGYGYSQSRRSQGSPSYRKQAGLSLFR